MRFVPTDGKSEPGPERYRAKVEMTRAPVLRALGFLSAWGRGAASLPADAQATAGGRAVLSLGRPAYAGDRFRRATRECLLGIAAVDAMLEDARPDGGRSAREAIAGERTALLYVTAGAYVPSNRLFIERAGGGTHFAYTAPAVVPAEVAIEFHLGGPSAIFIGGPPATLQAIWYAARLLEARACDRALVLAVEIFEECSDLYARGARLTARPLVEAAACAWLEPGLGTLGLECDRGRRRRDPEGIRRRLGEAFACEPFAALDLGRRAALSECFEVSGVWQGQRATLSWTGAFAGAATRGTGAAPAVSAARTER